MVLLICLVLLAKQKNHTVTQSSFADPCSPLSANWHYWLRLRIVRICLGPLVTSIDANVHSMPVDASATTFPTWNYTVTATTPVWAFVSFPSN